jgi:ADP-ribosylglycohydrolase
MDDPPDNLDRFILDRIHGSLMGLALGDTLGAQVEFHSHETLENNPVTDLREGGTWGLKRGQVSSSSLV